MSNVSKKKAETQPFVEVKKKFSNKIERVVFTNEMRGTINLTSDGKSYLVGRNGVSIKSGSDSVELGYSQNQVVISGGGSGGSPGGSDTQVQFNDGGSFGGDSGLTYDKTTATLTVTNLDTTSSPAVGFVPKFQYFNLGAFMNVSPGGNPTPHLNLEWDGTAVTNADPEAATNNNFWKYFPYGGEIVRVFANGSSAANPDPSYSFDKKLVFTLSTYTDEFVAASHQHGDAGIIGHMTASATTLSADSGGGNYQHRALYNFSSSTITGTMIIPAGQIARLTVKGQGTGVGFGHLFLSVTYKMNLK